MIGQVDQQVDLVVDVDDVTSFQVRFGHVWWNGKVNGLKTADGLRFDAGKADVALSGYDLNMFSDGAHGSKAAAKDKRCLKGIYGQRCPVGHFDLDDHILVRKKPRLLQEKPDLDLSPAQHAAAAQGPARRTPSAGEEPPFNDGLSRFQQVRVVSESGPSQNEKWFTGYKMSHCRGL